MTWPRSVVNHKGLALEGADGHWKKENGFPDILVSSFPSLLMLLASHLKIATLGKKLVNVHYLSMTLKGL